MKKRHFQLSLIALLILLPVVVSLVGCMPASEDEDWENKYETLKIEKTILTADLRTLQSDVAYLRTTSDTLRDEYDTMKAEYNTLKAENGTLRATSKKLQADYDSVQTTYNAIQTEHDTLRADYNALEALYNDVTDELAEINKSSPPSPTPTITPSSILKKGLHLIAQDSTYLGTLDSEFVSESIFNDFGKCGSEFSSTSIWNDFSKYGSLFSSLSAFNDLASEPPMLYDVDKFICYVTTNTLKSPRTSPYSLIAFAESMGWK